MTAKELRKKIRDGKLREVTAGFEIHMRSSWGKMPVADIMFDHEGRITCYFHLHGIRNFRTLKEFSYNCYFGIKGYSNSTGVHYYEED